MKVPVVTGTGVRLEIDSEQMVDGVLEEACAGIDPALWDLFVEQPPTGEAGSELL